VDVTHKKRGRPPLKAEEATLRPYPATEGPASSRTSLAATSSGRGLGHARTSSREIRPITDLQFSRPGEYVGAIREAGLDPAVSHLQRWPHPAFQTAQLSPPSSRPVQGNLGQRPFSSPVFHQSSAPYPLPPYIIPFPPSSTNPMAAGLMSGPARSPGEMTPYIDPYPRTQPASSPQYQPPYPAPLPLHGEGSLISSQPLGHQRSVSREYMEPYSPLRLPPLVPSPREVPQTPSVHRRSESYPPLPTWAPGWRPEQERALHPQEVSRGALESTSSQSELHSPQSPVSRRQPGGVSRKRQASPTRTPTEGQLVHEAERDEGEEGGRRTKRRRMALDDMVND
jgi:hypothetical protein